MIVADFKAAAHAALVDLENRWLDVFFFSFLPFRAAFFSMFSPSLLVTDKQVTGVDRPSRLAQHPRARRRCYGQGRVSTWALGGGGKHGGLTVGERATARRDGRPR